LPKAPGYALCVRDHAANLSRFTPGVVAYGGNKWIFSPSVYMVLCNILVNIVASTHKLMPPVDLLGSQWAFF
jgi:hypothetical protein